MSLNCSPLIRPSLHMRVPAYAHTRIRMRTCTLGVKKTCDNTLSCCCTDARAYGWDLPQAPQLTWSRFIENKVSQPCICFACVRMRPPIAAVEADEGMWSTCVADLVVHRHTLLAPLVAHGNTLSDALGCASSYSHRTTRSCGSTAFTQAFSRVPASISFR